MQLRGWDVRFSRKQRLVLAVVPPVATVLVRLLGGTLRWQDRLKDGARPADRVDEGDLYAFWHRSLLLAAYRYRDLRIRILISSSFDGELIARVVERLGFVPVRGSSSRGGAVGLLQMDRALRQGWKAAVTADGPKGPMYVAKPGVAALALRAAARGEGRVSVFHIHPERAWRLHTWDDFLIPKPFSRVCCAWPAPVNVQAGESIETVHARMQTAMELAVDLAERSDTLD